MSYLVIGRQRRYATGEARRRVRPPRAKVRGPIAAFQDRSTSRSGRNSRMHEHIVRSYDQELELLDKKIAQMGGQVEQLLARGFDALERRDPQLAESIVAEDRKVDALEGEIQDLTIQM